ncbi:hypothetical protein [Leisingera caerulea]|uniref:hypothetical protein n=1 Tax=Leisingera caerulea TaxID=506591 RepID=UPI00040E0F24|nr:hypothetical protein [Leisingera caerulea]
MREAREFSYILAQLRGDGFRQAAEELCSRLLGGDGQPEFETGSRKARQFFYGLIRQMETARSGVINEREEPDDLAAAIFDPLIASAEEGRLDPAELAAAARSLKSILQGVWHMPFPAHTYGITQPAPDHPDHAWCGQGGFARDLQVRNRITVQPIDDMADLKRFRGLIVRRSPTPHELMLAGAAMARGIPVSSVGDAGLPIRAFPSLQEAFEDVRAAAISQYGAEVSEGAQDQILHEGLLEVLAAKIGAGAGDAALMARCRILEEALSDARSLAIRRADDQALRDANYIDLLRGSEFEKTFFDIYANYRRGSGNPESVDVLSRALARVRHLEEQVLELKSCLSGSPEGNEDNLAPPGRDL